MARPMAALVLTDDEREALGRLVRRGKVERRTADRARVVLACAAEVRPSNKAVAGQLNVTPATVGKWRDRFVRHRLDGLLDEPRCGAPRTVTDERVEAVVVRTLESKPATGATHWSTRGMARATGLGRTTLGRIWQAFGLQPHRTGTFKLSPDPQFVEKVRDVVGLYMSPPVNAVVLCVDEKSQIQALDRTQPLLPMSPRQAERRTNNYARHGTTSLFAALNAATGEVVSQFHRRHRSREFRTFLDAIDAAVPGDLDVPRRDGQLRDAQDEAGQELAGQAAPVPLPLHADVLVLAEPGRAAVRRGDRPVRAARLPPEHGRVGGGDQDLPGQPGAAAVRVDQDGRRDPGQRRAVRHTDTGTTTRRIHNGLRAQDTSGSSLLDRGVEAG